MDPAVIERERFYDEQIAPVLVTLSQRCFVRGLSFLAVVEWDQGEVGRTVAMQADRGPQIDNAHAAVLAGNNADSLIMHIMKKATRHGHGSLFLKQLGVPLAPPAGEA